jgi:hypothetical protein
MRDGIKVKWVDTCMVTTHVINDLIVGQLLAPNLYVREPMNLLVASLKISGCIASFCFGAVPNPTTSE